MLMLIEAKLKMQQAEQLDFEIFFGTKKNIENNYENVWWIRKQLRTLCCFLKIWQYKKIKYSDLIY